MGEAEGQGRDIDEILQRMFHSRGFDLRSYKMSDLQRRISRRMDVLEISSLAEYSEYLEAKPDEYEALFNTILVNISQFFRDPEAWNFVREDILPEILEGSDEIRLWSAGCASGEEPYSLAIMLAEVLGDDLSKRTIRIHATDIDEAALKFARSGTYTLDQSAGVPEDMREKYFTHHGDVYSIVEYVKDLLIFSRHNLVSDPPISRIDLLLCRNVLIYFDQALQARIIPKLQYALSDTGYLWLGKAETVVADVNRFRPVSIKWRIFEKISSSIGTRLDSVDRITKDTKTDPMHTKFVGANRVFAPDLIEQVIQNIRVGFVVLDKDFNVIMCNQIIREIWGVLPEQILGRPFFDLEISYRPVDLRYRIEQAVATGELSVVEDAEYWITKDKQTYLKIEIIPLASGVIIFLTDVTEQHEVRKELQVTNEAIEIANEKFLSTNEELKRANREFQSVNENLQSINEELESTNQHLRATNEELRARIAELDALNCHHEGAEE